MLAVDGHDRDISAINIDLPEWIVYIIIAAVLMIGILVVLFLRKSRTTVDEEWEEEI